MWSYTAEVSCAYCFHSYALGIILLILTSVHVNKRYKKGLLQQIRVDYHDPSHLKICEEVNVWLIPLLPIGPQILIKQVHRELPSYVRNIETLVCLLKLL